VAEAVTENDVCVAVRYRVDQQRNFIRIISIIAVHHDDDVCVRANVPESQKVSVAVADLFLSDHSGSRFAGFPGGVIGGLVHYDDLGDIVFQRLLSLVHDFADGGLVHRGDDDRYLNVPYFAWIFDFRLYCRLDLRRLHAIPQGQRPLPHSISREYRWAAYKLYPIV
jgi:hypothetical protein